MVSDSALSAAPIRQTSSRRRRKKSIARLFGALAIPANEAERANRLRDGCCIPLDLDYVRPDCLLPAEIAALYSEMDNFPDSDTLLGGNISQVTIYLRLNFVRIAIYENQSVEIEIGIFDQFSERFVSSSIVLSSNANSLSDWVGFVNLDITPSCIVIVRIYAIGALVKDCSSIRNCRRQIGFSSCPLSYVFSEAPLTQHDLAVIRPKTDRSFAKLLTSTSAANRFQQSMAFKLRLQMANMIPQGTPYHCSLGLPANGLLERSTFIRFDLLCGEFKNTLKSSQMNICIEASVIVRGTTRELACLSRGSGSLCTKFESGIIYHCNSPEFHECFMVNVNAIRNEVKNEHVSLLLRALHVARCGIVTTLGYIALMVFDRGTGKISTTNGHTVAVHLLDISNNKKTKNRIIFRSSAVSAHETDDDILAMVLAGKALHKDLKLAHSRIDHCSNIDALLQTKLMDHYILKGSYRQDATSNAAWSLYCLLRRKSLHSRGVSFHPIQAEILFANLILCFRLNLPDLAQLSVELFHDPSTIIMTDVAKSLVDSVIVEASKASCSLSGRTLTLLFKFFAAVLAPDQLRTAYERLCVKMNISYAEERLRIELAEDFHLDRLTVSFSLVAHACELAANSAEICCLFARHLSTLLHVKYSEESIPNLLLLLLLRRLHSIIQVNSADKSQIDLQILTIEILRVLHSTNFVFPPKEVPIHLAFVLKVANCSIFDRSHIILRIMELHAATLILDMTPVMPEIDISVPRAVLTLLNGMDMQLSGSRKRRADYISLHIDHWLRPWILNILIRHSAISPDQTILELLVHFMIRSNAQLGETLVLLEKWQRLANSGQFELAVSHEAFLIIHERRLYPCAIEFFKQLEGSWESQSFLAFFEYLNEANSACLEGNSDQRIDALVSALQAVRHIKEAQQIRLYIIDELICLYDSIQLTGPELAQCYLERGENQLSTDPGRLSDFRKALQISTDCFEWEKAAMICERIIYGCSGPDKDPSFVSHFRRVRADLLRRIQTEDRVMPQYARVAFAECSSHHASERGREYVYRLRTGESALEFSDRFRKQYPYADIRNTYSELTEVESHPVITIQRIEVSSLFQNEENESDDDTDSLGLPVRFRHFALHSDASAFSFARMEILPSIRGEGDLTPEADISRQWYRIHYIKVANKFPCLSRRQPILSHKQYWQSPIQTAILTVRQVTQKLQREMEKIIFAAKQKDGNIDVSQLSLVLTGIIDAPVNGGIAVYQSCFLRDTERYSDEQEELSNVIRHQRSVLKKGLNLFKDSISPALLPLHAHLENQLQKTFPE